MPDDFAMNDPFGNASAFARPSSYEEPNHRGLCDREAIILCYSAVGPSRRRRRHSPDRSPPGLADRGGWRARTVSGARGARACRRPRRRRRAHRLDRLKAIVQRHVLVPP